MSELKNTALEKAIQESSKVREEEEEINTNYG